MPSVDMGLMWCLAMQLSLSGQSEYRNCPAHVRKMQAQLVHGCMVGDGHLGAETSRHHVTHGPVRQVCHAQTSWQQLTRAALTPR